MSLVLGGGRIEGSTRTLILGASGMLGQAVEAHWRERGASVLALGREQADITQASAVAAAVTGFRPSLIVNCAALTRVDDCEGERPLAMAVNGEAVGNVVSAAAAVHAVLIQISTDYVFDGEGDSPHAEDSPVAPKSVYGASKLEGERQARSYPDSLIVRISWLFGPGGPNFVDTILRLLGEGPHPLRVVDDQIGCPTYTPYLAAALWDLADRGATGLVHYRNAPSTSWHGFAIEVARLSGSSEEILPVSTGEMPRPAPRPAYSVLAVEILEKALGRRVESWKDGLAEYLGSKRG